MALTHQHLLLSFDALMDHQEAVDDVVGRPLHSFWPCRADATVNLYRSCKPSKPRVGRGRKLSDSGTKARLNHAVKEAHLEQRIRAHAMVCFFALIVYRVMRKKLKLAKRDLSPEKVLSILSWIQRHKLSIQTTRGR